MKPLPSLMAVAVAMAAMSGSGCWEGITCDVRATVLAVEGTARATLDGKSVELNPHQPSSFPGRGDMIETAADSHAAIALLPNALGQLGGETQVELVRLSLTKDGNETGDAMRRRGGKVKLLRGWIVMWHERRDNAEVEFVIATAEGELLVNSDALFRIEAATGRTRVTSVAGEVRFRGGSGSPIPIEPGYVGEWSAAASNFFAAETDERAQREVVEALASEENLRALRRQMRNRFPVAAGKK